MPNSTDVEPPVSRETLQLIVPVFFGCLAAFFLFGVSIVQMYIYYISYPGDSRTIKFTAYGTFVLDLIQTVVVAGHGYGTLCEQWGRPKAGAFIYWYIGPIPIVASTLALWCQAFYAWRIYQLGGWLSVASLIMIVSLAQTGGGWAIGVVTQSLPKVSDLHRTNMFARTIVWLGGGALADIMIMLSMVYLLYSTRNTSFIMRRSELLINRLIRLSVETGCLCAITASLELITFLALPKTSIHFVFSFMLAKVYSNTLMASLNSRRGPMPWRAASEAKTAPTAEPASVFSFPQFRVTQETHIETGLPEVLNGSSDSDRDVFTTKGLSKSPLQGYELRTVHKEHSV
ncbi:hypothetical protein K488DRAFT_84515 [Vararia minispora EC-137]|uniref:Uncharacterized protein n=1 Tax=Vararia minispora EC-137 TaxID=1314806 RepID=A0ACB8QPU9_9AGAM|nr:hypothetical protein K488DRAFT_84515 [Vararia minispora EC-137]